MGQELADRHAILHGPSERGHVALDRCIELEQARVHEQHAGGREAHHFGERGEVVQRADLDGPGVVDAVVAHWREQGEPAVPSHGEHATRECAAVDLGSDIRDDVSEARAVEPQR